MEIDSQINDLKSELSSVYGKDSINAGESLDEMRRKLADTSITLEETKERYRRQIAKQQKDIEENEQMLDEHRLEEKKMRVKINKIENDLVD